MAVAARRPEPERRSAVADRGTIQGRAFAARQAVCGARSDNCQAAIGSLRPG
jgi:hypothetical protein